VVSELEDRVILWWCVQLKYICLFANPLQGPMSGLETSPSMDARLPGVSLSTSKLLLLMFKSQVLFIIEFDRGRCVRQPLEAVVSQ